MWGPRLLLWLVLYQPYLVIEFTNHQVSLWGLRVLEKRQEGGTLPAQVGSLPHEISQTIKEGLN